jgi:2'-hydroxyisoflavone reductase
VRLLLLGGPRFLGRAVLAEALARGHDVTTFNRSGTDDVAWPGVESLRGDRDGGLEALDGRSFDAVVDTSGYVPRIVAAGAELLRDAVEHYVFVSSISVYASFASPVDETASVAALADPTSEDVPTDYGALKARCEEVVETAFPGAATHVRAGLIVGPHDPTGRFTYWPHRVARGGEVLVPAPLDRQVQLVDVRDLGAWLVRCAERGTAGIFNATCTFSFADVLEAARSVTGADAVLRAVDPGFLVEQGVGEWMELPVWVDERQEDWRRFMDVDTSRAGEAGLVARPIVETVRGALEHADPVDGVGLAPDRERELLAAWRARSGD